MLLLAYGADNFVQARHQEEGREIWGEAPSIGTVAPALL
jgi:hypothetical protein